MIQPGANSRNKLIALLVFAGLTAAVFVFSGVITATSVSYWYPTLVKPSFNPPSWVFTPVWTVLYLTMPIAAWMAWNRAPDDRRRFVVRAFGLQLWLNLLWSTLFFGLHWIGAALIDVILLWGSILWTIRVFWAVDRRAGLLFVPYACWVGFAAILNAAIWILN